MSSEEEESDNDDDDSFVVGVVGVSISTWGCIRPGIGLRFLIPQLPTSPVEKRAERGLSLRITVTSPEEGSSTGGGSLLFEEVGRWMDREMRQGREVNARETSSPGGGCCAAAIASSVAKKKSFIVDVSGYAEASDLGSFGLR